MNDTCPSGGKAAKKLVDSCVTNIVELKKRSRFLRRSVDRLPRWVTPNIVTVSRTLLAAPIIWAELSGRFALALAVFVAAMLLDFLDGALAEVRGLKTTLGAFLDPLSDKILVCGALLALIPVLPVAFIPFIYGTCMIAAALTVVRVAKMSKKQPTAASIIAKPAGKLKCIVESTSIGLILLGLAISSMAVIWAGGALLVAALVLAGLSLRSQVSG